MSESLNFDLIPADNKRLANLCGKFNENLSQLEKHFDVGISCSSNQFHISGEASNSIATMQLIKKLYSVADKEVLAPTLVQLYLNESSEDNVTEDVKGEMPKWQVKTRKGPIKGRGQHQKDYLDKIKNNDLSMGIGPAGTEKLIWL